MDPNRVPTAVFLTPEMQTRLTGLVVEVLGLLKDGAETPEEALIVLDAARRELETTSGVEIVRPIENEGPEKTN